MARVTLIAHLAVLWHGDTTLDDRILSIFPLVLGVAHQEGAIRVQVNARKRQLFLLGLVEQFCSMLKNHLERWLSLSLFIDIYQVT